MLEVLINEEVIDKNKFKSTEWVKSAIIQTTITGIAALTFAFYSQYKEKQTFTENLMRYTIFSSMEINALSVKVSDELVKIDKGFSFSHIINNGDN